MAMADLNLLAVAAAIVAAFVISSTWYSVFGTRMLELRGIDPTQEQDPLPGWKVAVEVVRSAIVALAIAVGASLLDLRGVRDALLAGVVVWIAFPVVLLAGSVIWEDVPTKLAAIHSGDWLLKLLAITTIVTLWR
jgi:hypothetical protein